MASAMIDTPSAAKFALSCVERVCRWVIDSGHREMANPATGPKRQIDVPPPTHARFAPAGEIAAELAKLDASGCSEAVKLAIRFTVLTAKRLCEVRRAVDGDGPRGADVDDPGTVQCEGSRRTTWCRCRAPRCGCCIARANCRSRTAWSSPTRPRTTGWSRTRRSGGRCSAGIAVSPHGFRSTFRTWAQERGENWEAAEISLSHRVGGSVVASYARSDMLALRRDLMERYASAVAV